jgi:1-acyl-sn-glycerol-3-phosphate acyltransferase
MIRRIMATQPTQPIPFADDERPPIRLYYRLGRAFAQMLYVMLLSGRVFGVDRVPVRGGAVLACNHQSFMDPVLATLALPRECSYMARDTLFANPLFRRLIESLNAFPVRRGASDVAAMKAALTKLRDGAILTAFPEATRTPDGRVYPMKPGVVVMARKAGVPLVPVAIEGAYDAWSRHQKWPRSARVWVEYGTPIAPHELRAAARDDSTKRLTTEIRTIHNELRVRAGKGPFVYDD